MRVRPKHFRRGGLVLPTRRHSIFIQALNEAFVKVSASTSRPNAQSNSDYKMFGHTATEPLEPRGVF